MDYNLAKKLKDAGYPLPQHTDCDRESGGCCRCGDDNQELCIPTLSSLIEACGDKFEELRKEEPYFIAVGSNERYVSYNQQASTPEQAVALLWLKLHEKYD